MSAETQASSQSSELGYETACRFPKFSQLPPEIRHSIWEFVCFQERNIPIDIQFNDVPDREDYLDLYYTCQYITTLPSPAILHSTRESRAQGLKHYNLAFGESFDFPAVGDSPDGWDSFPAVSVEVPATIYINWKVDRLCVILPRQFYVSQGECLLDDFFEICSRNKLQRVAVNINEGVTCAEICDIHERVAEVTIFTDDGDSLWSNLSKSRRPLKFIDANPDNRDFQPDETSDFSLIELVQMRARAGKEYLDRLVRKQEKSTDLKKDSMTKRLEQSVKFRNSIRLVHVDDDFGSEEPTSQDED